jgi:RimJ/RimL family protein N-acetyltransferase
LACIASNIARMQAPLLNTQRLALRTARLDDAPFILQLLNEPSFIRFIGDRQVRTLEQARNYIVTGPMQSYQDRGYGLWLTQLTGSAIPIGLCGLVKRDYLPDADIGFAFMPTYWSQGLALEAASAVVEYAFHSLAMQRLVAIVQPDNTASLKLLHKLGLGNARAIKTAANQPELLLLERKHSNIASP